MPGLCKVMQGYALTIISDTHFFVFFQLLFFLLLLLFLRIEIV